MADAAKMFRDAQPLLEPEPERAAATPATYAAAYHLVGGNLLRSAVLHVRPQAALASVEIFRTAVEATPDDSSLRNALGAALVSAARFGSGEAGLRHLSDAEQAFQIAVTLARRQRAQRAVRLRYAINLATAQWLRGERSDDSVAIAQAEQALRSIAAELPASSPYRAHVRDNLGNALMALGRPAEAVAAYQAALAARQSASERARSLNNLGTALVELKNWSEGRQCYRDALALLSEDEAPLAWGLAQHNLATAWLQEALQVRGPEARQQALSEAVAAFEAALGVRLCEQTPLDWAVTTVNLADALLALGTHQCTSAGAAEREAGLARIRGAIDRYQKALPELTRADAEKTTHNLQIAREVLTKVAGAVAASPETSWPTETYATAHRERKENIVEFLTRVWLPLIKLGGVDLRTLRLRDPSAAKAIDNFRQRIDPATGERRQLPPELDIPTKKQLNDRLAAAVTDPGQRPARLDWALRSRARRERMKENVSR